MMEKPDDPEYLAWLDEIEDHYAIQGPVATLEEIDRVPSGDTLPLVLLRKGVILARMQRWQAAYPILASLENTNNFKGFPEEMDLLTTLGNTLLNLRRFDEAKSCLQKAAALSESALTPRILLARITLEQGHIEQGEQEIHALEQNDLFRNNTELWLAKARLLIIQKKFEAAAALAEKVLAQDEADLLAYTILGESLFQLDRLEECVRVLLLSLEIWPYNKSRLFLMINALIKLGRYENALPIIQTGIKIYPDEPFFYYRQAAVFHHLNAWQDALDSVNKSIELDPEESTYWATRSLILHNMGEKEKALEDLQEAFARPPVAQLAHSLETYYKGLK